MPENHLTVTRGFRYLLSSFSTYIARELEIEFGSSWWQAAVIDKLYDDQKRNLPQSGEWAALVDSLDIQCCLLLFDLHWQQVFRRKLSIDNRNWAKELSLTRNKLAHIGGNDFTDDDTWRALDTMSRLAEQIDPECAEEIRELLRVSRYGSEQGSTALTEAARISSSPQQMRLGILHSSIGGLPSWRDVIEPHPDVAQGRYRNAEFAANLAQVARGEGSFEYRDPVEFFNRTYVTEGLSGLLEQALRRVCGKDGEPVIQLKTSFGGGKTHSLLALYHLMRGRVSIEKIPNIKPVLESAEVSSLPKANVAVLVGVDLDPSKAKRPNNMPGITINTLWGEMAAQLAESAGDFSLYDYVREADKKGVSPGAEALKQLFDAAGPCLILMDELVSYAKKLGNKKDLPAGTFDNFIVFIQEITEAVRASKNSLVVASIPESEIEVGGDEGKVALQTIEHTFGRMESIWKPVAASEGFEVVRRRLFLNCKNEELREVVCASFSRMYLENQRDFPAETKELEYKERLISCYPIHPEVFDRLYEDWATLERFQRTRGVLRLMATVIHELWMGNDSGLMIMPGSVPLDAPQVRHELMRHLPNAEQWNPIVDSEIDGRNSTPYKTDQSNPRYGNSMAARRVSRTIMLGSAPSERSQNVRGIEASRIRLGVAQPGENVLLFNDALNSLQRTLTYLYSSPSDDRFWYDTRPTLRKIAEDRATQQSPSDVEYEIETRLRSLRNEKPFTGVHICPKSSLDVPDDQSARMVILAPAAEYKAANPSNQAQIAVEDILNNRGNSPRIYRNMLAFIAPDWELMASLQQEVRRYLAWKSIKEDSETLNLDATQNKETESSLRRSNETVDFRIKEAYCWLLMPYIDRSETPPKTITWDITRLSGGSDTIIGKAAKRMLQNEAIITTWAPSLLLMELNNLLWKDTSEIQVKKLWEYLCTYCYLPRLVNIQVLEEAIRAGINSTEYFAFAAAVDGSRYVDLKINRHIEIVERSGYLVKKDVAMKQIEAETLPQPPAHGVTLAGGGTGTTQGGGGGIPPMVYPPTGGGTQTAIGENQTQELANTRFFLSAELDNTRVNRDVQHLLEEIIKHLLDEDGCEVELTLEVNAKARKGFSRQTVRTVSENSRTSKVKSFGFEE